MKLPDVIICVVLLTGLSIRSVTGEQSYIEFDSYFYHYSNPEHSISLISVSENYDVILTGKSFTAKSDKRVFRNKPAKITTQVTCQLFISFYKRLAGINSCQNKDGQYYLFASPDVSQYWTPMYFGWRVICENPLSELIEGEEIYIRCKVQRTTDSHYKTDKLLIGWIQGGYNITQLFNLNAVTFIDFNQTLKGFYSGEGLFFYCLTTTYGHRCYTLLLKVHPGLQVKLTTFGTRRTVCGQRCFKCEAFGGLDEKNYNWTLNDINLRFENNATDACFNNLKAGHYIVECLVSTKTQKNSDVMEFTVGNVTTSEYNNFGHDSKNLTITLAVTTTFLGIAVLILLYLLNRKRGPCSWMQNKNTSIRRTSRSQQTDEEAVYHYIERDHDGQALCQHAQAVKTLQKNPQNQQTSEAMYLDIIDDGDELRASQEVGRFKKDQTTEFNGENIYLDILDEEEKPAASQHRQIVDMLKKDTQTIEKYGDDIYLDIIDDEKHSESQHRQVVDTLKENTQTTEINGENIYLDIVDDEEKLSESQHRQVVDTLKKNTQTTEIYGENIYLDILDDGMSLQQANSDR